MNLTQAILAGLALGIKEWLFGHYLLREGEIRGGVIAIALAGKMGVHGMVDFYAQHPITERELFIEAAAGEFNVSPDLIEALMDVHDPEVPANTATALAGALAHTNRFAFAA